MTTKSVSTRRRCQTAGSLWSAGCALLLLVVPQLAIAQCGGGATEGGMLGGGGHAGHQGNVGPLPSRNAASGQLLQSLGLSAEQQQSLNAIVSDYQRQAAELATQFAQKNVELHLLAHNATTDLDRLASLTQELGALYARSLEGSARAQQAAYRLLTPAQQQLLLQEDLLLLPKPGEGDPTRSHWIAAGSLLLGSTGQAAGPQRAGGVGIEQAVYTCPMHPQIRSDRPGKCPLCGMTLVAKQGE